MVTRPHTVTEIVDADVSGRASYSLDLDLVQRLVLRLTDQDIVALRVSICELSVKATPEQLPHHEIFAGIAGRNSTPALGRLAPAPVDGDRQTLLLRGLAGAKFALGAGWRH